MSGCRRPALPTAALNSSCSSKNAIDPLGQALAQAQRPPHVGPDRAPSRNSPADIASLLGHTLAVHLPTYIPATEREPGPLRAGSVWPWQGLGEILVKLQPIPHSLRQGRTWP